MSPEPTQMQHPAPVGTVVKLNINATCQVDVTVTQAAQLNSTDNSYHYDNLQGQVGDGNTVVSIYFSDVVQQVLVLPTE